MSVETLHAAETAAGNAIGLSNNIINDILKEQRTRIVSLGELAVEMDNGNTLYIPAWRGISGPDDGSMDKGGSRMTAVGVRGDLDALPQDMWAKSHQIGLRDYQGKPINGGKLLFQVNPNELSRGEKTRAFAAAAHGMHLAGRAGYNKSVPAGDMGTNDPTFMDAYAWRLKRLGYKHWEASITGTSPAIGGLEFRPHATGYGVYHAIKHQRQHNQKLGRRVTFSGAGNVGGYAGFYASNDEDDPSYIRGYSDAKGTLYVDDKETTTGIRVTRELLDIMDNANFAHDPRYQEYKGNKLKAMHDVLAHTQPDLKLEVKDDPNYIMQVPTDIFVPASVRGLIDGQAADDLNAYAVNEAGNDTITSDGYASLAKRKIEVVPGTVSNAGGVTSSMDGQIALIEGKNLNFEQGQQLATESAVARLQRMERMATLLGTRDYNLAACAIGMAGMALQLNHEVDSRIKLILAA